MPRRGWSSIPTPSGWYEVIRGPRPPSVQWPHVSKGKGQGNGKKISPVVSTPQKSQGQSKVARLEAALKALGQEQSPSKTSLEEALKMAKEDVPKPVHPQQRCAEASARVERLEAALKVLGEGPRCRTVERIHARRVKKQVARAEEQVRNAMEVQRQMEEKLANGLRDLEVLRGEASRQPSGDGGGTHGGNHQIEGTGGRALVSTRNTPRYRVNSPKEGPNYGWHRYRARCRRTERIRSHVDVDRRSRFHFEGSRERCPVMGVRIGEASNPGPQSNARRVPEHPS